MRRGRWAWLLLVAVAAAACSTARVQAGIFHSDTGYRVTLPPGGWTVVKSGDADLELRRSEPAGGIAVSATCEGAPPGRPLPLLARHLTFGLADRRTLERGPAEVGGAAAERLVLSGRVDGTEVMVEAVVTKDARCVYDFLYVASPESFEAGRPAFRALIGSFAAGRPGR
ncbi:MAG TPA: hypothetical protein VMT79_20020 [Candidatus Binatia bacterium]|nr:hypothetical protein [Candidatus Binatia bacterium]